MAKYTINTKQMDKNYPYNIISIDSYVDGKYIEICYTLGIPNTVLYGKTETIEYIIIKLIIKVMDIIRVIVFQHITVSLIKCQINT